MKVTLTKAIRKVKAVGEAKLDKKESKELNALLDNLVAVKEVNEEKPNGDNKPTGGTKVEVNKVITDKN